MVLVGRHCMTFLILVFDFVFCELVEQFIFNALFIYFNLCLLVAVVQRTTRN